MRETEDESQSVPSPEKQDPSQVLRTPPPATEPRDGPTRNCHEKYEKKAFGLKFWTPRIYPENNPKIPKKYPQNTKNDCFWYFFGIFGVFRWGSQMSAWVLFFRYFLWKFRVGPSRGSVAGGGILNPSCWPHSAGYVYNRTLRGQPEGPRIVRMTGKGG